MERMVFIILVIVSFVNSDDNGCKCSRVDKSFERILCRKKRFVVFPKSSTVLLTPSFTKALISGYPRGLVTSTEIDIYHPLPDTLDGWRPKIFEKSKPTATPTTTSPKNYMFIYPNVNHSFPGFRTPTEWGTDSHYEFSHGFPIEDPWPTSSLPKKHNYFPKEYAFVDPSFSVNGGRIDGSPSHQSSTEDWMHFRPHRERREIYQTLEEAGRAFGFDMKSCILRTICETKHFLLPPGKSFIQDVIRILFTFPTKDEWTDDYSTASKSDDQNCSDIYKNTCRISLIDFFISNRFINNLY